MTPVRTAPASSVVPKTTTSASLAVAPSRLVGPVGSCARSPSRDDCAPALSLAAVRMRALVLVEMRPRPRAGPFVVTRPRSALAIPASSPRATRMAPTDGTFWRGPANGLGMSPPKLWPCIVRVQLPPPPPCPPPSPPPSSLLRRYIVPLRCFFLKGATFQGIAVFLFVSLVTCYSRRVRGGLSETLRQLRSSERTRAARDFPVDPLHRHVPSNNPLSSSAARYTTRNSYI